MNYLEIFIGALIGFILTKVLEALIKVYYNFVDKTMDINYSSIRNYDKIINYYEKNNDLNDLYSCTINDFSIRIPFITKPEWCNLYYNIYNDNYLNYKKSNEIFHVNKHVIKKRQKHGQKLYNAPTLYIDSIIVNENGIYNFNVKKCMYFEMFTLLASFENETLNRLNKYRIKNNYLPNANTGFLIKKRPISIGCQVALVLQKDNKYYFAIQNRSKKTITFGNTKALIPVFGMSPIVDESDQNLLIYNFYKEYCEELFNAVELDEEFAQKRANPKWFYNLSYIKNLESLVQSNKVTFEILGFGFDGFNGSLTLGLLYLIKDDKHAEEIINNTKCNWEISESELHNSIQFIDSEDNILAKWLQEHKYHYGSAFTISEALKRLKMFKNL